MPGHVVPRASDAGLAPVMIAICYVFPRSFDHLHLPPTSITHTHTHTHIHHTHTHTYTNNLSCRRPAAEDGVVIATVKKMPSVLVDESSLHKVVKLTDTIGMVYSGMGPDSRVLMSQGRKLAQQYYRVYQEPIPTLQLVRQLASVMQEYTQQGGVRPFGVSLLICGFDLSGKPLLFQVDPSVRHVTPRTHFTHKHPRIARARTPHTHTPTPTASLTNVHVLAPQFAHTCNTQHTQASFSFFPFYFLASIVN
jgi:hypothetical protein